jgi:hypothetical protein
MTDALVRELERVGRRGSARGAAAVYAAARDEADTVPVDLTSHRRRPRRGPMVLRVAMVVLVLALALVFAVSRQMSPGRPLAPRDLLPSQIFDPRRQQVDEWLDGYDPAEIQHLYDTKDEEFGEVSDELLLSTLEFRRMCRFMQRGIDAAASATSETERVTVVASIVEPQIDRYLERVGPEGDGDEMWRRLMSWIQAGDAVRAQPTVTANCEDSFGPWVDGE